MKKFTSLLAAIAVSSSVEAVGISGNTYNPAISLILDGRYASFSQDPETYRLAGFPLVGESGPGEAGLALGESELNLSANIDHLYYGHMTAAFAPEGELEVEESYVQTLALGGGFNLKAGRFLSNIGYLNRQHKHSWDFADTALAYRGMLGGRYADDGLQVTWLAPTPLFMELSAEAMRGEGYPAAGAGNEGLGASTAAVHIGGDVGHSHSWRAGYSVLNATADGRGELGGDLFTGDSQVSIVDAVWKWAPNGNPRQRNLVLQAEYLQRRESGVFGPDGGQLAYTGDQSGWYIQAVYQFMPRWRVGLRQGGLSSDNTGAGVAGTELDSAGHSPARSSLMLDFSASEYSRLRLQYNRDHSSASADEQWMLQYTMSLGAHGAHAF
ncbi:MAG: hypothetical protein HUJ29_02875 [Gammaproteobacteria bacterium]|nr:hypothetical protein [Gammaproteobacteria bacterium]